MAERKRIAQLKLQKKRWQTILGPGSKQLCLTMIVKNEAHIILETLRHLQKTNFDCWCIVDTGSTDKTCELINQYFKDECPTIPGQLFKRNWRDFGYNRTEALQLAYGASLFILMFDADDLIEGDFPVINWNTLHQNRVDALNALFGTGDGLQYWRQSIFRNDGTWFYEGILHEYPLCSKGTNVVIEKLIHPTGSTASYFFLSRRLGDRNKNQHKYRDDALKLMKALKTKPNNHRYVFYVGQSWYDYNDFAKAKDWYRKRVKLAGWREEQWYSQFRVGECFQNLQRNDEAVEEFQKAWEMCPHRYESLMRILTLYRTEKNWDAGYERIKTLPFPLPFPYDDLLFINTKVYDFGIYGEAIMFAYEKKDYVLAGRFASFILKNSKLTTTEQKEQWTNNLKAFLHLSRHPPPPPPSATSTSSSSTSHPPAATSASSSSLASSSSSTAVEGKTTTSPQKSTETKQTEVALPKQNQTRPDLPPRIGLPSLLTRSDHDFEFYSSEFPALSSGSPSPQNPILNNNIITVQKFDILQSFNGDNKKNALFQEEKQLAASVKIEPVIETLTTIHQHSECDVVKQPPATQFEVDDGFTFLTMTRLVFCFLLLLLFCFLV